MRKSKVAKKVRRQYKRKPVVEEIGSLSFGRSRDGFHIHACTPKGNMNVLLYGEQTPDAILGAAKSLLSSMRVQALPVGVQ